MLIKQKFENNIYETIASNEFVIFMTQKWHVVIND